MREIKFRAWAEFEQRMLTMYDMRDFKFREIEKMPELEYMLMQYTGLKDRKGQEIYENDIVTFDDAHYQIVFKGEGWTLCAVHSDNLSPYDMPNLYMQELINSPGHTRTDVVGNIYENPELLK